MSGSYYINGEDQRKMLEMMDRYNEMTDFGKHQTNQSELLMNILFSKYIDKIIKGIIYSKVYGFNKMAEVEDLTNEARYRVYLSIIKNQFDPTRGTKLFTFISTVISKNLKTYTKHLNRHRHRVADIDFDLVIQSDKLKYFDNLDSETTIDMIFEEAHNFFEGKPKFQRLAELLKNYYFINVGKPFVKKRFIEYAQAFSFSPSYINTFFNNLKKIKPIKVIITDIMKEPRNKRGHK